MTTVSYGYKTAAAAHRADAGSALDDPNLLSTLVKSAKSAHSTLGRALDTNLSHRRFGGAEMEPSALTMRRLERERQLRLQRDLQRVCGDSSAGGSGARSQATADGIGGGTAGHVARTVGVQNASDPLNAQRTLAASAYGSSQRQLHIPALPTMAPSMMAAADDGTESLGGTKIGGDDRGYVTLIGAVPTFATTRRIEDNYELISSFRAYRTDAQRMEQQAALRDVSAPHPDLLEQLVPLIQQRQQGDATTSPSHHLALVDVETLPYELRQMYTLQRSRTLANDAAAAENAASTAVANHDLDGTAAGAAATAGAAQTAGTARGTWAFTCQGRPDAEKASAAQHALGHRQPVVGQYQVRYAVVEPRVLGGYVMPQVAATTARRSGAGAEAEEEEHGALVDLDGPRGDASVAGDANRNDADMASVFGQTLRDDLLSATSRRGGNWDGGNNDGVATAEAHTSFPTGENVKGSSMFLSQVPRQTNTGTAAPDVCYWPYPDVRSTVKRTPCLVQLDTPITQRRREPLVSGVPASVYEVSGDISANQPRTVTMDRSTGRGTHWFGRGPAPTNGDPLDLDGALRATRPKERTAFLPQRTQANDITSGATAAAGAAVDTSVSVERNLDYPRPFIGNTEQLGHVRDFGKERSRAEREASEMHGRTTAASTADTTLYDVYGQPVEREDGAAWTEARSHSAIIHPSAPGHQALHAPLVTELGDVPSLALTKPRMGCVTDLGKGSVRPAHMAPLHDLTYNTECGYALTGGRVKGTPSIGRTVTRQQVSGPPTEGCGAKVMYNPTDYLAPNVKSVPDFEKQITKEHEFRGHRVQSERYLRLFPSAPGPGHYTVNFSQVE